MKRYTAAKDELKCLLKSYRDSGGKPRMPEGGRPRVQAALEFALLNHDAWNAHMKFLADELRSPPRSWMLEDHEQQRVVAKGLGVLDDQRLAALTFSPVALAFLRPEVTDLSGLEDEDVQDFVWTQLSLEIGASLPQRRAFSKKLRQVEGWIFSGAEGFSPGDQISIKHVSELLGMTEEDCRMHILPVLVDLNLLVPLPDPDSDLSAIVQAPSSYVVPRYSRQDHWTLWERYHHEVVFSCLLAARPAAIRKAAIEAVRRKMELFEQMDPKNIADVIRQDRDCHLTLCYYGAPTHYQLPALTNLERSFNRMNAVLPAKEAEDNFDNVIFQHREILDAFDSIQGESISLDNYKQLLEAYRVHLLTVGLGGHDFDESFMAGFEGSVLREVYALRSAEADGRMSVPEGPERRWREHMETREMENKDEYLKRISLLDNAA